MINYVLYSVVGVMNCNSYSIIIMHVYLHTKKHKSLNCIIILQVVCIITHMPGDNVVGIVLSWIGARFVSVLQNIQTSSGAHPAPSSMGTGGYFLMGKVARPWS
jgi:hypothetical protein